MAPVFKIFMYQYAQFTFMSNEILLRSSTYVNKSEATGVQCGRGGERCPTYPASTSSCYQPGGLCMEQGPQEK